MSPKSLPANPNLKHLRNEAREVLNAHKSGNASCCAVLSNLYQFQGKSDGEILKGAVRLQEVQFAISIEYGFKNWAEMKSHIEPVTDGKDERLTKKGWETSHFHKGDGFVLDDEAEAVNAMAAKVDGFPQWVLDIRDAMPKYGFEICSHRWLDGLDEIMRMVGSERFWPTTSGHCGDVPGYIVDAAENRAAAVEAWLEGRSSDASSIQSTVAKWLGDKTPEKEDAARCFVELARAFFAEPRPNAHGMELSQEWRSRTEQNPILATMFQGEGFDNLLQNRCGYKVVDRLDLYIRIIGGDETDAHERHGVCNDQLRYMLRDDPERFTMSRGYLWGLYAYLAGQDEQWLRENKPECAGAAIHALQTVSQCGESTPLRRWLVASLLKTTKTWIQGVSDQKWHDTNPSYPKDLPELAGCV